MARTLLIATMRNEAPYILEWIAWHRMVGVDAFLIYSNDCDDPTDAILSRLDAIGLITWVQNSSKFGNQPQKAALNAARAHPLYDQAEWVGTIDVDEFIQIHAGAGNLEDLFAAVPDANLISLPWRMFGNAWTVEYDPAPVIAQFRMASPPYIYRPWQITGFKTLHRPLGHWASIGPHRPYDLTAKPEDIQWVGGAGQPIPEHFLVRGWRSEPGHFGDSLAQINHYGVRSAEAFLVKSDRGPPTKAETRAEFEYWCMRNFNMVEEPSAAKRLPALQAGIAELLADPELAMLQVEAEQQHRRAIAELKADPHYGALFERIVEWRPTGSFTTFRDDDKKVYDFKFPEVKNQDTSH